MDLEGAEGAEEGKADEEEEDIEEGDLVVVAETAKKERRWMGARMTRLV